jgi:transcriptional regulator with XRE-family HTH domain
MGNNANRVKEFGHIVLETNTPGQVKPMPAGERIRYFRILKGLTHKEMALSLEISPQAYGKIERNQTSLSLERLTQIAELLGMPAWQIIGPQPVSVQNPNLHEDATQKAEQPKSTSKHTGADSGLKKDVTLPEEITDNRSKDGGERRLDLHEENAPEEDSRTEVAGKGIYLLPPELHQSAVKNHFVRNPDQEKSQNACLWRIIDYQQNEIEKLRQEKIQLLELLRILQPALGRNT